MEFYNNGGDNMIHHADNCKQKPCTCGFTKQMEQAKAKQPKEVKQFRK